MDRYMHTVQYYETDKMGITHHSNYIRWMEEARVDFLTKIGWSYDKLESCGIVSPVIGLDCTYKKPTAFPDEVYVTVSIEEFKGVKLKIGYYMENAKGETVFEGHSMHCFLNENGMPIKLAKEFPGFNAALLKHMKDNQE